MNLRSGEKKRITNMADLTTQQQTFIKTTVSETIDTNLEEILRKLANEFQGKNDEAMAKLNTRLDQMETNLGARIEAIDTKYTKKFEVIELDQHNQGIEVAALKKKIVNYEERIESFENKLTQQDQVVKKLMKKMNDHDQHNRRWCLRVNGFEKPKSPYEEQYVSKQLVLTMLRDHLDINLDPMEVDSSHRLGAPSKTNKQTIYIRLLHRSNVELILKRRKSLVGSGYSIMEDVSEDNRGLLNRLNDDDRIDDSWYTRGKLWGNTKEGDKYQFEAYDNITERLEAPEKSKNAKRERRYEDGSLAKTERPNRRNKGKKEGANEETSVKSV